MNTLQELEQTTEFESYIQYLKELFSDNGKQQNYSASYDVKQKWIVVWLDMYTNKSAYAFIDKDGNIYKPASWKVPAKHIRGNIFNPDNGKECSGRYGIARLRG